MMTLDEAIKDMKVDIPVPKAAVTQTKRNIALDMAVDVLSNCSEFPNSWIPCTKDTKFDEFKKCWVTMSDGKVKKLCYNPEYIPYPWITRHGCLVFGNKDILAYIPIEKPEPYQPKGD